MSATRTVEPHPVTYREGDPRTWVVDDPEAFYRVEKMRFGGKRPNQDRTTIHYNDRITLTDVPEAAYRLRRERQERDRARHGAPIGHEGTPTTRRPRRAATSSTTPTASPLRRWAIRHTR